MAKSGQSSKSPKYIRLIISTIHLGGVLDIVTVLIKSAFGKRHFPLCGVLMKIQQSKRPGPPTASRRAPPSRAEGG